MRKTKKIRTGLTKDESMILWPFLDFAEEGNDQLARYLLHCGIDDADIGDAGDVQAAILWHYRRLDGTYDIDAAAPRPFSLAANRGAGQGIEAGASHRKMLNFPYDFEVMDGSAV
jgi:hypothetical protein